MEQIAGQATDRIESNYLVMEVCTSYHRITGEALTLAFRTNGVLNSSLPYILLHNATTSNLMRPSDPPIVSSHCRVTKNDILLAIPNEEAENDRLARRPPNLLQRELLQQRVLVGIGNFEVSGNLHLDQPLAIDTVLLDRSDGFVALTGASIVYVPNFSTKFAASTVLINRKQINFVSAGIP